MVETAVFENSSETILSEGLAYDWCDVGVVTDIDPAQTLPAYFIHDAEQMAKVTRTQVDIVLPSGTAVLNAADQHVAGLAPLCDGDVIFFAASPEQATMVAHREQGKRSVFVRADHIVLASGSEETPISTLPPQERPVPIEHVLAAVAAAWALGVSVDLIRVGIETFEYADASAA
jgi:cyanophycin synthetase